MTFIFNEQRSDKPYSLFLGEKLAVQEYTNPRYPKFVQLYEDMEEVRWKDNEIGLQTEAIQMKSLSEGNRHLFVSNFQFQILADSIQGRGPFFLLPYVSAPELELTVGSWGSFEQLHSKSYTHILRSIFTDPSEILSDISPANKVLMRRTQHLIDRYEEFLAKPTELNLYFAIIAINILEALQFYCSFACTFAFANAPMGLFEGVAKILQMIARDENYHTAITQNIINIWRQGLDPNPIWQHIANDPKNTAIALKMFEDTVKGEKKWGTYLFSKGASLPGINEKVIHHIIEFYANKRLNNIGLPKIFDTVRDPAPWMQQKWLTSKNRQVAPQETEVIAYRAGTVEGTSKDIVSRELSHWLKEI